MKRAMGIRTFRPGIPEWVTLIGLLAVGGAMAIGAVGGWGIALVPAITFTLAMGMAYWLYRRVAREQALAQTARPAPAEHEDLTAATSRGIREVTMPMATFRVVGGGGVCLLGRKRGDLLTIDRGGSVVPQVCPYATAVLHLAIEAGAEADVDQWCCPVYDHFLVFRREVRVA